MIALPLNYLPKYFTKKSILTFFSVTLFCSIIYFNKSLPLLWLVFGLLEVVFFFYFLNKITIKWRHLSINFFEKKLFLTSFWIRLIWVFFSYYFFYFMTNTPFEFEAGDSKGYHGEAIWLAGLLQENKSNVYLDYIGKNYSDMGYPFYLGTLYYIIGENILVPRLIKALLGSLTCLLLYKLTRNNFGEAVGRMAGIMAMLVPNLIYYCGLHLKETEMVFLVVCFVYLADKIIRSPKPQFKDIVWLSILGASLFFFRTVLAGCLIGSVVIAILFTSKRVSSLGRRIWLVVLVAAGVVFIATTPLADNINGYLNASDYNLNNQMSNYALYRKKGEGNKLATYGSRSVFLPLMVIAPFPTLVDIPDQPNAMMMGGGYFTRNVYAFFVLVGLFALYKRKQLRDHLLLVTVIFSYIFVLASSGFALSERFHLPLVPFLLVFAAYGISQMNQKNKKYYVPYLVLVSLIIIGWNWFKLAGRS